MAANPIVVVDEIIIEKLPEKFRSDPRYQKGSSLELVPVTQVSLTRDDEASGDWRRLEGILAIEGKPFSATEWKNKQKELELAHDERKFGIERPFW